MSVTVNINGSNYTIPTVSETGWASSVTTWIQAASSHLLQKTGGTFTLSAEVDFGGSFGLKALYLKSQTANPASGGVVRLARADEIRWRDNANAADLELGVNASDQLTWNGNPIVGSSALTASRALQSNASGVIEASTVTATELALLSGRTTALVDTAAAQTIAGVKTFSDAPVFNGTVDFQEESSASTPASGYLRAYAKTDKKLYTKDSNGVETQIGASGSSGRNYIANPDFEANATTNWALFNTTLTSGKPTGSISAGAASVTTFATTATNPLAGTYSLQTASSAAWAAGAGFITDAFTIDREDLGKVLRLTVNFEITSGSTNCNLSGTTSNTFGFWIYDATNSLWTEMVGTYVMNKTSGELLAEVQLPTTCTSARVAVVCVNASAGAVTINWDNISFGPREIARGAVVTDPVAYTPTFTGFGTVSSVNFISWRDGAFLNIQGTFTTGTSTATEGRVTLGFNGVSANVTSSSTYPTLQAVGRFSQNFSSTTYFGEMALIEASKTYLTAGVQSSTTNEITKANGNDIAGTGKVVSVFASVRIEGWSSTANISSDFGGRDISVRAVKTSAANHTSSGSEQVVLWDSAETYDTTSSFDPSTGIFTAPETGKYYINANVSFAASATGQRYLSVTKNSTICAYGPTLGGYAGIGTGCSVSTEIDLVTGDTIKLSAYQSSGGTLAYSTGTGANSLTISKKQSPQTLVGSEAVAASYYATASNGASTTQSANFDTKVFDTHNAVTAAAAGTGTWKFTAPISKMYAITGTVFLTTNAGANIVIYKNGTAYQVAGVTVAAAGNGTFAALVQLNAGDYIDQRLSSSLTQTGSTLSASTSTIQIRSVN